MAVNVLKYRHGISAAMIFLLQTHEFEDANTLVALKKLTRKLLLRIAYMK